MPARKVGFFGQILLCPNAIEPVISYVGTKCRPGNMKFGTPLEIKPEVVGFELTLDKVGFLLGFLFKFLKLDFHKQNVISGG